MNTESDVTIIRKVSFARGVPNHVRENMVPEQVDSLYYISDYNMYVDLSTDRAFHSMDPRVCVKLPFVGTALSTFRKQIEKDLGHQLTLHNSLNTVLNKMNVVSMGANHKFSINDGTRTTYVSCDYYITDDPDKPQGMKLEYRDREYDIHETCPKMAQAAMRKAMQEGRDTKRGW